MRFQYEAAELDHEQKVRHNYVDHTFSVAGEVQTSTQPVPDKGFVPLWTGNDVAGGGSGLLCACCRLDVDENLSTTRLFKFPCQNMTRPQV